MQLLIYTDGASRGNPGPSAVGVIIKNEENIDLVKISKCIGTATNNVAEYKAVLLALREAEKLKAEKITLFVDSELLSKQLLGLYKVKSNLLRPYYNDIINIIKKFKSFSVNHISRQYYLDADKLANEALDSTMK